MLYLQQFNKRAATDLTERILCAINTPRRSLRLSQATSQSARACGSYLSMLSDTSVKSRRLRPTASYCPSSLQTSAAQSNRPGPIVSFLLRTDRPTRQERLHLLRMNRCAEGNIACLFAVTAAVFYKHQAMYRPGRARACAQTGTSRGRVLVVSELRSAPGGFCRVLMATGRITSASVTDSPWMTSLYV